MAATYTSQLDLAEDYLAEAALIDLADFEHNTRSGLHLASLAGVWTALVAGFGGMRHTASELRFKPRLPSGISRLNFGLVLAGRTLRVEITGTLAAYSLGAGEPLELVHYGQPITLAAGKPVTCRIPELPPMVGPRPTQPMGRAPERHHQDVT